MESTHDADPSLIHLCLLLKLNSLKPWTHDILVFFLFTLVDIPTQLLLLFRQVRKHKQTNTHLLNKCTKCQVFFHKWLPSETASFVVLRFWTTPTGPKRKEPSRSQGTSHWGVKVHITFAPACPSPITNVHKTPFLMEMEPGAQSSTFFTMPTRILIMNSFKQSFSSRSR